jgi:hypothetical protein
MVRVVAGGYKAGRRDRLAFHRDDILDSDRRVVSRRRTALLGASFVTAALLVVRSLTGGGSAQDPGNGNGTIPF